MADKYGAGMGIKKVFDKAAEAVATAAKNYVNKSSVSRSAKDLPIWGMLQKLSGNVSLQTNVQQRKRIKQHG
jgi:hypothetical protein